MNAVYDCDCGLCYNGHFQRLSNVIFVVYNVVLVFHKRNVILCSLFGDVFLKTLCFFFQGQQPRTSLPDSNALVEVQLEIHRIYLSFLFSNEWSCRTFLLNCEWSQHVQINTRCRSIMPIYNFLINLSKRTFLASCTEHTCTPISTLDTSKSLVQ